MQAHRLRARELASAVASASTPSISTDNPASRLHHRARRGLVLFALASVALHIVLLAALPGFEAMQIVPEARVLDVVLVEASAATAIVSEPSAPPKPDTSPPKRDAVPKAPVAKPRIDRQATRQGKPETHRATEPDTPPPQAPSASRQQSHANPTPSIPVAPPAPDPGRAASGTKPLPTHEAAPVTPPAFTASYLTNPAPRYPLIARRNGEQGTVTLRVLVTRDGAPARVTIEQTSGSRHLDGAALETVKTWRFVPARKGDEAIEAWVIVPIVFRLEGAS
jgi:protein TonB